MVSISCGINHQEFYVDPLDITLSMEYLNDDIYRLHIDKGNSNYVDNYIDFRYELSEMPCMWLYFPYGKSDAIYIREENGRVESYQCNDYQINVSRTIMLDSIPNTGYNFTYDKNNPIIILTDSCKVEIPCVTILIEPYISDIVVFDDINKKQYKMKKGDEIEVLPLNTYRRVH